MEYWSGWSWPVARSQQARNPPHFRFHRYMEAELVHVVCGCPRFTTSISASKHVLLNHSMPIFWRQNSQHWDQLHHDVKDPKKISSSYLTCSASIATGPLKTVSNCRWMDTSKRPSTWLYCSRSTLKCVSASCLSILVNLKMSKKINNLIEFSWKSYN